MEPAMCNYPPVQIHYSYKVVKAVASCPILGMSVRLCLFVKIRTLTYRVMTAGTFTRSMLSVIKASVGFGANTKMLACNKVGERNQLVYFGIELCRLML